MGNSVLTKDILNLALEADSLRLVCLKNMASC